MKKLKLLIADSNTILLNELANRLMCDSQIEWVSVVNNGLEAYEIITTRQPDVVIFDLLLPFYDGFTLIEKLKREGNCSEETKFVMTTPLTNDLLISESFRIGVDYVLIKPYDIDIMAQKIKRIYTVTDIMSCNNGHVQDIDEIISNNLTNIGIPANLIGYRYMITAIKQVLNDATALDGVTKILYPDVARVHNSTPQRVEKAIRHAIEVAWSRNDENKDKMEFRYSIRPGKLRPTNSEFLAVMSRQIKA